MGVVSREVEMVVAGRVLHAAVTVSSLGPRRPIPAMSSSSTTSPKLLLAQKIRRWQKSLAASPTKIKNPLTPIQLSSQRLIRHLQRRTESETAEPLVPN